MRLPPLFRTTAFRLTLMFLALFAAAAALFLAFIYVATAGEVQRRADRDIRREMSTLESEMAAGGIDGLNAALIERAVQSGEYVYVLTSADGEVISGSIAQSPVDEMEGGDTWTSFQITELRDDGREEAHSARGLQRRLETGHLLFVGADVSEAQAYVMRIVRSLYGAGAVIILLGLAGGLLISRNIRKSGAELIRVVNAVQGGDLQVRAQLKGTGDEYDELASGLNGMLDRIERLMGGLRHAGDAIAHDLRSPLTRLRTRLEVAMIEVEAGKEDAGVALHRALEDADGVLRTFNAVLAISRLQAAGEAPDQVVFDAGELAADICELYEPLCEDKGLEYAAELAKGLMMRGNREFVAQALANLLDNAVKYTPEGGAVMLRTRRRSTGDIEFSVTDTGPGVPEEDRARIVQRFVRLEQSRNQPGSGLGLSLVQAVAEAHGGRLEIDEGPGRVGEFGPGLRTALVFPAA